MAQSIPANAIPNARPSYYTQNQWNALTKQAKIDEVGYHLPAQTTSTPSRTSTTQRASSSPSTPQRTTGVIVLSNRGSPVTDVQSGLQLQAGQGVVNVAGGTRGGGISIPISAPTQTSGGVTSVPSTTGLRVLTGGIQTAQTPQVQALVQFQPPVVPQINLQSLREITAKLPTTESISAQIKPVAETVTKGVESLPLLRPPSFSVSNLPTFFKQTGQAGFQYVQQHPLRVAGEVALGLGVVFLPEFLAPIKVVKYAKPFFKLAGTAFVTKTGFEFITASPEQKPAILGEALVDIAALGAGAVIGGKAVQALLPRPKVYTDIPISKVRVTREKIIPQLGEGVKFTEVKSVSEVADLSQVFKVPGVKQEVTAGLGLAEQQVVALGRGTKTGKPFALTFETAREISPSAVLGEQVAGTVKARFTPQFISSLQEPKISILLTPEQRIPSTLKGQFRGTFADEILTGEVKGIVRTGKQSVGAIQQFKVFETPSPPVFAGADLRRFAVVSEGLVVRRPTSSLFISAEDIIRGQSRRSILGKTVSQEFLGITEGERAGVKSAEITQIKYPKIGKPRLKTPEISKLAERPVMGQAETKTLLAQIQEREFGRQRLLKLAEESLPSKLAVPALTRAIGETKVTREKVSLGTIRITTFPKTEKPFILTGIPKVKTPFEAGPTSIFPSPSQPIPFVPPPEIVKPSAPIKGVPTFGGVTGKKGVTGISSIFKPISGIQTGLGTGTRPSIGLLPRFGQVSGVSQISGLSQALAQLQGQTQLQRQLQKQGQLQRTLQVQKQITRFRPVFPKLPKLLPPRPPRLPPFRFALPFGVRPKTEKILRRKGKRFREKKFAPIPFADYLSVTQTAIKTGGRATQPRITKRAGFRYLRAVQRGQLRFPTVEQMRGLA